MSVYLNLYMYVCISTYVNANLCVNVEYLFHVLTGNLKD